MKYIIFDFDGTIGESHSEDPAGYDACKKAGGEIGGGLCQDHRSSIG